MMPCIVSCGVWRDGTTSAMLTTPRSVSTPGTTSLAAGFWKSTSFMLSSRNSRMAGRSLAPVRPFGHASRPTGAPATGIG